MSKPNVGELRKTKDVGGLIAALGDTDWRVHRYAADALGDESSSVHRDAAEKKKCREGIAPFIRHRLYCRLLAYSQPANADVNPGKPLLLAS